MLVLGNRIGVSEYVINSDGYWVLLDESTKEKYCFNTEGEAWSLAMGHNNVLYLNAVSDRTKAYPPHRREAGCSKRGFNFFQNTSEPHFSFGSQGSPNIAVDQAYNPFVFGDDVQSESSKINRNEQTRASKIPNLVKWFRRDESKE